MASPSQSVAAENPPRQSVERLAYSGRVALLLIAARADGGLGLVGERVAVGGWVKSFTVRPKSDAPRSPPQILPPAAVEGRDATCSEVLFKIPILRSIANMLGRGNEPTKHRGIKLALKKAMPSVAYLRINDGSCVANLQVVVDSSICPLEQVTAIGTSILAEGVIEKVQMRGKYVVELKVDKLLHVGSVNPQKYPLSKTRLSLESIRSFSHFRARTTTVASLARVRNTMTHATHTFFQKNGFLFVHMPIITTTDMNPNQKKFYVTQLFNNAKDGLMGSSVKDRDAINLEVVRASSVKDRDAINLEVVRAAIRDKNKRIEELKRSDSNKEALIAAQLDVQKANELAQQLEEQEKALKQGKLDFSKDYFGQPAYLSPFPGLHLETYACALSSVYTCGPKFQAEDSQPTKHLAESSTIEVELAFAAVEDAMKCAEDCLKSLCSSVLANCSDDLKFLSSRVDDKCIDRIQSIVSAPFARISYAEALEMFKKVTDRTFESKAEWGVHLSNEHQSYLANELYKQPVIIYEYPKELKPFYARLRDDGRTVTAFDIIVPKAGVVASGMQKEERIDALTSRIEELGFPQKQLEWYLDLRRHGTVKHSGFSVNFENMVMFISGLNDVRDVVPFPRSKGEANC
ncbi:Asparagine--tRNA ligase, cytoplasmic 2 [Ananas comosus]|uniref:Asparagine--tRNA ligase, cytoplasmic 2 n=1 Tax=Ananas comosus TaxID=4615 RepID=A0A199VSL4_ANACO|nr:Asparagine--tRNA ligase, cytoplasmic 2 [Ananas comosus]